MLYLEISFQTLRRKVIFSALSDEERLLFRALIKGCDKKIHPGLQRYTWDTDVADIYIVECLSFTSMVIRFVLVVCSIYSFTSET